MNHETGALSLLKSFLTKACFTVGLCTSAYWSVAKIHQSFSPSQPESARKEEGQTLRDKVESLNRDQNLGTLPSMAQAKPRRVRRILRDAAPVKIVEPAQSPAVAESVVQAAAESPSPSPADAQVQGQEANNGEIPAAEPFYPNPYAYHQQMVEMVREEMARENAAKSGSGAGPNSPAENTLGQPAGGQLIKPTTGGGQVYGGINLGAGGNTIEVKSNLSQQDIQWLLSSSFKASVPSQQIQVAARKADGSAAPNTQVWTSRWDLDEGVKPEASFAIRSSSGGYPVQFEFTINLESNNGTPMPVQFSMKPTTSVAKNDAQNGHPVRVYTFTASEVTFRANTSNSEALKGLSVQLTYDISNGTAVLTGGSFAFQRAAVKTDATQWEIGRAIASTNDQLIVDQFPFSMKLEKSQ